MSSFACRGSTRCSYDGRRIELSPFRSDFYFLLRQLCPMHVTAEKDGVLPWMPCSLPNAPTNPIASPPSFSAQAANGHATGLSCPSWTKYQSVVGIIDLNVLTYQTAAGRYGPRSPSSTQRDQKRTAVGSI